MQKQENVSKKEQFCAKSKELRKNTNLMEKFQLAEENKCHCVCEVVVVEKT